MSSIGRNEPCPCGSGKKWKKCHGNPLRPGGPSSPWEALAEAFTLDQDEGIESAASNLAALRQELAEFDPVKVVAGCAALASLADNHNRIFRIDSLIHLAALHCAGSKIPTRAEYARWLNEYLPESHVIRFEDPPEDFAIGNVCIPAGDRLVFNGEWSSPDQILQDILDALEAAPASLNRARASVHSMLSLSNHIAERYGYSRDTAGSIDLVEVQIPPSDTELWRLSMLSVLDESALAQAGIELADIEPFTLTFEELRADARRAKVKQVRSRPILQVGNIRMLLFPTSLPMAIVWFVLKQIESARMLSSLNNAIRPRQLEKTFGEVIQNMNRDEMEQHLLSRNAGLRPTSISQTAFRFDINKHVHLIFLHDELDLVCRDGLDGSWRPNGGEAFAEHIEATAKTLCTQADYSGGLTIIVVGGVGRGFEIPVPKLLPEGWFLQIWSSIDFERLIWLESEWPLTLWKMSHQQTTLETFNIHFETPSDANFYAAWTEADYRLIPLQVLEPPRADIVLGCGYIFKFRERARKHVAQHSIFRPDRQEWVRVCRTLSRSYFKEDEDRPTFGSPESARTGILEGAIESERRAWWIDCRARAASKDDRYYLFKIWETAMVWFVRLASFLDQSFPELPFGNIIVDLDLSQIIGKLDLRPAALESIAPMSRFPVNVSDGCIKVTVPMAFVAMGQHPRNIAERALVETFVYGTALLSGVKDPDARTASLVNALDIRDGQRFMHMFEAKDARDYLRQYDAGKPELLKDADVYFAPAGVAQETGVEIPRHIVGVDECCAVLNRLVDTFWLRCKRRLQSLDRRTLVQRCLTNHERMLSEQDNWQRTRRATTAMHEDRRDVVSASRQVKEQLDRSQITHRAIVEMAICACPVAGGREASQTDIDYLGSQVLLLMATAAQSDAVRNGAVPASIRTSLAGDFRLESDMVTVMQPYLSSHFEQTHLRDVSDYERHYESSIRETKTEVEVFGSQFVEAFQKEFGISPIHLAEVADILAQDAVQRETSIVEGTRESVRALLLEKGITEQEVDGVLANFVLPVRKNWEQVEPPFRSKDWRPWRFRRKLSLMTRPIVALNDLELIYAPAFCEDSFHHVVMECFTGAFETEYFVTQAMKQYIGKENARRGLAFNKSVAQLFEAAGWNVRLELPMTELKAPPNEATGDIDVLAWREDSVCICECKELLFAGTITDVSEQLARFRGKKGDDLSKHLRRAQWLTAHPDRLERIAGRRTFRFRSLLVTSKIVPMKYIAGLPVEVFAADDLRAHLNGTETPSQ